MEENLKDSENKVDGENVKDSDEKKNELLWREVGNMSFKALQKAKEMVKVGVKLIDVADSVESFVVNEGFDLAFPLNLSINDQAAHYTPTLNDDKVFGEKDVVKLDFGAAKEGILGDCAVTVDLSGEYSKMLEATELALANAISVIKPGIRMYEIGIEIAKTIEGMGFKPIKNLGGHGVGVHDLHIDPFVPNFDNGDDSELEVGDIIAIEPFATTEAGRGQVANSDTVEIYSFVFPAPVRSKDSRLLIEKIAKRNEHEPFAVRWFGNILGSKFGLYAAIGELVRSNALNPHPVLIERGKGIVSQHEGQVIVTEGGCEVITK